MVFKKSNDMKTKRLKKIICRYILTSISIAILAFSVQAAPEISKINGSVNDGNSITISGNGFGEKSTASPIKWDNFDNGNDGSVIFGWTNLTGTPVNPTYSDDNLRTGKGLNYKVRLGNSSGSANNRIEQSFFDANKMFLSFWIRYYGGASTDLIGWQTKLWRLRNESAGILLSKCIQYKTDDSGTPYFNLGDEVPVVSKYGFVKYPTQSWILLEAELQLSDPNVANGIIKEWNSTISGPITKVHDSSNTVLRITPEGWNEFILGEYMTTPIDAGGLGGTNFLNTYTEIYYDDVYLDRTWQRVVLGDNANYDSCTKREIQIPSAWSDGEITATINQGSFQNGDMAHLFVVDENGEANPTGYSLTFGSDTGETTAPAVPDGLSVS